MDAVHPTPCLAMLHLSPCCGSRHPSNTELWRACTCFPACLYLLPRGLSPTGVSPLPKTPRKPLANGTLWPRHDKSGHSAGPPAQGWNERLTPGSATARGCLLCSLIAGLPTRTLHLVTGGSSEEGMGREGSRHVYRPIFVAP